MLILIYINQSYIINKSLRIYDFAYIINKSHRMNDFNFKTANFILLLPTGNKEDGESFLSVKMLTKIFI